MDPQNIFVLLFVAAAAVYMVLRLRRVAAGQSKCACGTKSCGAASAACGTVKSAAKPGELPLISSSCGQGGCGCGKR